jgi:hypothetical protein
MSTPTRPLGVTLLALSWAISAVLLLLAAFQMRFGTVSLYGFPQSVVVEQARRAPFVAFWGIICGIIGFGLWTIQNWARIVTIICCFLHFFFSGGLFLIFFLGAASRGSDPANVIWIILGLAWDAIVAWYLLRPALAKVFHEAW